MRVTVAVLLVIAGCSDDDTRWYLSDGGHVYTWKGAEPMPPDLGAIIDNGVTAWIAEHPELDEVDLRATARAIRYVFLSGIAFPCDYHDGVCQGAYYNGRVTLAYGMGAYMLSMVIIPHELDHAIGVIHEWE